MIKHKDKLLQALEKDNTIHISVADSGVGIPKEDLPYIFNDFYTAESAPKDAKGSGLGLAITKRIIEAHDGTISVESEPGQGSTFVIHLPIHSTTSSPVAAELAKPNSGGSNGSKE